MKSAGSKLCRLALGLAVLIGVLASRPVGAAEIRASVNDSAGKALEDAVVTITPESGTATPEDAAGKATATIDQKDEMFVPEVVVIHTGGAVVFRDSDTVRHHVYSFSPIKQFQFVQQPGETSAPVRFDHPGIAAIGCNIHDFMIAYVYVTDAPWAIVTGADGLADFTGLPAGRFMVTVWHPRLWPDAPPLSQSVTLSGAGMTVPISLRVMPPRPRRSHNQLY